jgi:hypothetical protein
LLVVHDTTISYDTSTASLTVLDPEFTIEMSKFISSKLSTGTTINSGVIHNTGTTATITLKIGETLVEQNTQTWTSTVVISNISHTGTIGTSTVQYSIFKDLDFKTGFTITNITTTSTVEILLTNYQQLTLNIDEEIIPGTRITVIKRETERWTEESLLTSNVRQAAFLRARPAELPDSYYYGGELDLTDENFAPLTTDNGDSLQGF